MTLFEFNNKTSEIKSSGWNSDTLRPPFGIKEVLLDFRYQWFLYRSKQISIEKRLAFIILRIFQRFSYNLGYFLASRKFRKKSKNLGVL